MDSVAPKAVVDSSHSAESSPNTDGDATNFSRLFAQSPGFRALLRGPSHIIELANPNYLKLIGGRNVIGKTVEEALPDAVAQGYLDLLDRVYATGIAYAADSARYVVWADPLGPAYERYVDFVFQPVRNEDGDVDGIFVDGVDTTARVAAQQRRDGLSELAERVAMTGSAADISFLASEFLGRSLGVSRVGFGHIDQDEETLDVARDWCAPGVESLAGITRLRDYGDFIDSLRRNEFISISDVRLDARTASAADALESKSARSFVNAPVVEDGRLVAVFFVNFAEVRQWTADELDFVQDLGQRTVSWVERFQKTAALRVSEASLLAATDAAQLGIWELDLATQQLTASSHCKENFGRAPSDSFEYQELLAAVHRDDRPRMRAAVAHSVTSGEDYRIEYRINRPDGQLAWVRISGQVKFDAKGHALSISGISQDITDLMLAKRRAEVFDYLDRNLYGATDDPAEISYRAAEALGRLLDVSRAGYGTIDKKAETVTIERDWNAPGIQSLAGVLHFRDYGSYIDELKRGETVVFADANTDPRTLHNAQALITLSAQSVVNMPVSEAGNTVALLYLNNATARPWTPEELALIREVAHRTRQATERLRAESDLRRLADSLEHQVQARTAELMKAEAALRQSQKMEAVGQLTSGLAHDFNNLLAAVSGSLDMLKRRIGSNEALIHYVDVGQTATKRAAALTHRLLAFSRKQTLAPKVFFANQLIAGFEELIRRTIGLQVSLEVVSGFGIWPVQADPGQLENALLNLCLNARDAMPAGGRLVIESGNRTLDEAAAGELEMSPGDYLSISVSDSGTGMAPDVLARAFDPFFTTKPLGTGTGLGLSMVYGFAHQSGGQVRIHSEVGGGTQVVIYLPRYDGDVGRQGSAMEETPAVQAAGVGETILVVDDEESIRMLIVDLLSEIGYTTLEAGDGPSALEILRTNRSPALLLTDVGLPGGMNGRQLADAARVMYPSLKVLFVTGYAESSVLSHGLLPLGMQVLTKPFDMDTLAQRVHLLVEATTDPTVR